MAKIEDMVDDIINHHPSKAKDTPSFKFKRTRAVGKLSPFWMAILLIGIAAGMLTGLLTNMFYAQTQGDIELTGTMVPVFLYDGQPFTGRYYNTTVDVSALTAGTHFTQLHTIENADNGVWTIVFTDPTAAFRNDPNHQWYGFNFTVTLPNGDPLPEPYYFFPGQVKTVLFNYSLHREFVTAPDPLPFDLNMTIERTTPMIEAIDDSFTFGSGTDHDFYPMLNDLNITEGAMHIASITTYSPYHEGTTVNLVGNAIHVYRSQFDSNWMSGQTITLDYTIHSFDDTMTSTGTISITKS